MKQTKNDFISKLPQIDNSINGFNTSELTIIGGRILTGKTVLASIIAKNLILNNSISVGLLNFVTCNNSIIDFIMSNESSKNIEIFTSNLFITNINNRIFDLNDLKKYILSLVNTQKIQVIIINSLQYIKYSTGLKTIKSLYKLATNLNISIIIFSELKRNLELRDYPKVPNIKDLNCNPFHLAKPCLKYATNILFLHFENNFYTNSCNYLETIYLSSVKVNGIFKNVTAKLFNFNTSYNPTLKSLMRYNLIK